MIKTGKRGVVNDFLPNPNWRQCCFCFWIGEMRIAEMRQFGNAGSHQRQTSGGSSWTVPPENPHHPSTPLPALCTQCFWGKLSDLVHRRRRSVMRTAASANTPWTCFPCLSYVFVFVGAAPTASCDSQMIAMTPEPPPPRPRPPNTDDVCGLPRTMFVKLKSSAAEYFWRQVLYSFL